MKKGTVSSVTEKRSYEVVIFAYDKVQNINVVPVPFTKVGAKMAVQKMLDKQNIEFKFLSIEKSTYRGLV